MILLLSETTLLCYFFTFADKALLVFCHEKLHFPGGILFVCWTNHTSLAMSYYQDFLTFLDSFTLYLWFCCFPRLSPKKSSRIYDVILSANAKDQIEIWGIQNLKLFLSWCFVWLTSCIRLYWRITVSFKSCLNLNI